MTLLSELLSRYFLSNVKIRCQETRTHYERSVRQFGEFLEHDPTDADLTDDNCTGFMLWTLDQGLTEVTANQRVKQLRALWEWAARRRMVELFPTFKLFDEPEQQPVAYGPGQVNQLFAACAKQRGYIGPFPSDLWWLSQHWFYWATAERTEATLLLQREHLDIASGIARVPAKIRKGGRKAMAYRLPPRLCELLAEMNRYPSRSGLVWERQFDVGAYYHRYRRLVASAGLPTPRGKCGPKKMRITVLTMIRALGGDPTAFAKHSSTQVTDESYIDEALILAMQQGIWPPPNLNPEKPGGWLKRWLGRAS
jgi:integrase